MFSCVKWIYAAISVVKHIKCYLINNNEDNNNNNNIININSDISINISINVDSNFV